MSNKYTPCNGFIIASNGQQYPVETAHPLPLPEGIARTYESDFYDIVFGGRDSKAKWYGHQENDTHWLARRPLPEVPKVKTQEELDLEAFEKFWVHDAGQTIRSFATEAWFAAIAYARQCPDKPAA